MADTQYLIALILGTSRPGRFSEKAANFVLSVLKEYPEIQVEFVDPRNLKLPLDGNDDSESDPSYTDLVRRADGFIIVSPEYNHSFPGSLKRVLDSIPVHAGLYAHKPVALAGVSDGNWGGVRMIESLVHVVRELGLVTTKKDLHFPKVKELFNEDGTMKEPEEFHRRTRKMIDELLWMVKVLKAGRESDLGKSKSSA